MSVIGVRAASMVLAVLVLLLVGGSYPAAAEGSGTIVGRITYADGTPIDGETVRILELLDTADAMPVAAIATTDAQGRYEVTVPAGADYIPDFDWARLLYGPILPDGGAHGRVTWLDGRGEPVSSSSYVIRGLVAGQRVEANAFLARLDEWSVAMGTPKAWWSWQGKQSEYFLNVDGLVVAYSPVGTSSGGTLTFSAPDGRVLETSTHGDDESPTAGMQWWSTWPQCGYLPELPRTPRDRIDLTEIQAVTVTYTPTADPSRAISRTVTVDSTGCPPVAFYGRFRVDGWPKHVKTARDNVTLNVVLTPAPAHRGSVYRLKPLAHTVRRIKVATLNWALDGTTGRAQVTLPVPRRGSRRYELGVGLLTHSISRTVRVTRLPSKRKVTSRYQRDFGNSSQPRMH